MSRHFLGHGLIAWLAIAVLAFLNGWLREAVLVPGLGPGKGAYLSAALLIAAVGLVALGLGVMSRARRTARGLWGLGVLWAVLALALDTALIWASGAPVAATLTAQLNPAGGDMFGLVVVAALAAPRLLIRAHPGY